MLKHAVGVIMVAFGWFWFGEGIGIEWPNGDVAIPALIAVLGVASAIVIRMARVVRLAAASCPQAWP